MTRIACCVIVILLLGCRAQTNAGLGGPAPATPPTASAAKPAASSVLLTGELIDLTHAFDDQTIYWPTEKGFVFERGNNGVTAKGYYYAANRFFTAEHGGTHIDAPIHFYDHGETVDQIPLSRLIAPGVVVDVAEACAQDPDYQIRVADLRAWEEQHGQTLTDVIVLLRTGWSAHWPRRGKYLGTEVQGAEAVAQLHFPGLSPEAARWLVEHRAPKAIGIDTASIDYGQSTHFETHVMLYSHGVPAFENVAALERVPATGATIVALPMKIAGGSGGPLRIVAVLPP